MAFRLKAFAAVIVVSILAVYFLPVVLHHDVYDFDAAQHISWLFGYSHSSLFPNCGSRNYFVNNFDPPGFLSLYAGLSRITDLKITSELLCFPFAILALIGAHWLGRAVTDENVIGGITRAAIFLFGGLAGVEYNYMSAIAGGL